MADSLTFLKLYRESSDPLRYNGNGDIVIVVALPSGRVRHVALTKKQLAQLVVDAATILKNELED